MKPIGPRKYKEITECGIDTFNDLHGSNFTSWFHLDIAMNFNQNDESYPNGGPEDYSAYCKWVELQNSPLMNAMREAND